ncbi:hypothetical protein STEG23_033979 [Scotinomys teguina]
MEKVKTERSLGPAASQLSHLVSIRFTLSKKKHASFLAGALEGAARLKPGAAVQRAAPPSAAGSRAALRCRLNLGLFRCSPPPPVVPACPGPRVPPPCAFSSPCPIGWIVSEQKAALLFREDRL